MRFNIIVVNISYSIDIVHIFNFKIFITKTLQMAIIKTFLFIQYNQLYIVELVLNLFDFI